MRGSHLFGLGVLLGFGLIGCGMSLTGEKKPSYNVCPLPGVRRVLVSPEAASAGWVDAILYAFERWRSVVPGLTFTVLISDEASERSAPCTTSFVMYDFHPPEYEGPTFGDTKDGFVRIGRNSPLVGEQRRALLLHELGHLLFGFGHTTDRTSIMYPVVQDAPRLSVADEANARAAFLLRDGAMT